MSGHPLTVITAPAGAGKTTAIRQLLERRPEPCVWLTMQPRLDDPAALAGALGAVIGAEATPSVLAAGSADPSRLAGAMADDLDTRPAVVMLDDAHLVRSPAARLMLRGVAERLGPSPRLRGHRRSRGVPRVRCPEHGVRQVALARARPGSGFTLLFEALVMAMVKEMPVQAVASLIGEHETRVWRVVHHYANALRAADGNIRPDCQLPTVLRAAVRLRPARLGRAVEWHAARVAATGAPWRRRRPHGGQPQGWSTGSP